MDSKNKLFASGIWLLPLSIFLVIAINQFLQATDNNPLDILTCIKVILFFPLSVLIINCFRYLSGRRDFLPVWLKSPTTHSSQKSRAKYQPIPKNLVSEHPDGFTIGCQKTFGKTLYVRLPIYSDPLTGVKNKNLILLGGPGSYKTTILVSLLLYANWFHNNTKEKIAFFINDRKPDITKRCFNQNDEAALKIIRPTVSPSSGIPYKPGAIMDPFYGLSSESPDYKVLGRANLISRALVTMPDDGTSAYFYKNAQTLMSGIIMYGIYNNRSFIDVMLWIRTVPTDDIIAEILMDKAIIQTHPTIAGLVRIFESDGKNESIRDIETTLQTDTEIFLDERVRWQFGNNPNRISPEILDQGISISLEIPDNEGKQFEVLTTLFTELVIDCLRSMSEEHRQRPDAPQVMLILDEAGSFKIPSLVEALSIMRNRRVGILLACQSLDQLKSPQMYGPTGANVILDTVDTFVVLGVHAVETAKIFSEYCGSYSEKKYSVSNKAFTYLDIQKSESTEYRKVLEVSDLLHLQRDKEALIITDGRYCIVKKCPYFLIPEFLKKSRELEEMNSIQNGR